MSLFICSFALLLTSHRPGERVKSVITKHQDSQYSLVLRMYLQKVLSFGAKKILHGGCFYDSFSKSIAGGVRK